RDELLAGPGLAGDQHGRISRRNRLNLVEHAAERAAPTDDFVELMLAQNLVLQGELFAGELRVQLLDPFVGTRVTNRNRDLAGDARQQRELIGGKYAWRERAQVERAENPLRGGKRHRARGSNPALQNERARWKRREFRQRQDPRLPRREHDAGRRSPERPVSALRPLGFPAEVLWRVAHV